MELFDNLMLGFSTALQWNNLFFCFLGVLIGTAIGVLPGIGPIPTVALLLPFTFGMVPAKNDEIAAIASAVPARPWRAIW